MARALHRLFSIFASRIAICRVGAVQDVEARTAALLPALCCARRRKSPAEYVRRRRQGREPGFARIHPQPTTSLAEISTRGHPVATSQPAFVVIHRSVYDDRHPHHPHSRARV